MALELLRQRGGAIPPADIPEGAVHALDIVETDDRIQPLLQTLLGRTLIVDSLETATRLWRMSPDVLITSLARANHSANWASIPAGKARARNTTPCSRAETKSTNWKFS